MHNNRQNRLRYSRGIKAELEHNDEVHIHGNFLIDRTNETLGYRIQQIREEEERIANCGPVRVIMKDGVRVDVN